MSGLGSLFGGFFSPKPPATVTSLPAPKPDPVPDPVTQTPWVDWFKARDGWTEFDHDKELSKGWKYCGLDYTTVQGSDHAWCAMALNTALIENGYKGTGSAAAASFAKYGVPCGFVRGAIIPILHAGGGHHVTTFDHWVDETQRLAALRGANQSNAVRVSVYNLSGNSHGHDEVMNSPRWPVKSV